MTTQECRQWVLHIYNVESLYAAVVEALHPVAGGLGRGRHSRGAVRRSQRAPPRARAVHPQARHPAATRQLPPGGAGVDLRVRLLRVRVRTPQPSGASLDEGPRRVRHIGRSMDLGQHLDQAAQSRRRRQPRLRAHVRSARERRRGQQGAEAAAEVRRGGPNAWAGRCAVQPVARRRRLHAVLVDQLRRMALRESGTDTGSPPRLPRSCRSGRSGPPTAEGLGGTPTGESRPGRRIVAMTRPRLSRSLLSARAATRRLHPLSKTQRGPGRRQ